MPRHHEETIALLQRLGNGEVLDSLHDQIVELERAVSATGKKGSIQLKITIEPNGGRKRAIASDIKVTIPKEPSQVTYFFATDQCQFVEQDPDQRMLPLNTVQMTTPEPKVAGAK